MSAGKIDPIHRDKILARSWPDTETVFMRRFSAQQFVAMVI
jgi:hypothetical protein